MIIYLYSEKSPVTTPGQEEILILVEKFSQNVEFSVNIKDRCREAIRRNQTNLKLKCSGGEERGKYTKTRQREGNVIEHFRLVKLQKIEPHNNSV